MANFWIDNLQNDISTLIQNETISGIRVKNSDFTNQSQEQKVSKIQEACDLLEDRFDEGEDGFVALDVDSSSWGSKSAIIKAANELNSAINRENFMVAIPATIEGIKAMSELAKEDINIYAGYVYSPNQAAQCADALSSLSRLNQGYVGVSVADFDKSLNGLLAAAFLSKDRVGFFNAIKIYNNLQAKNLANVSVVFENLNVEQPWLESDYYIEQLNLHNSALLLDNNTLNYAKDKEYNPSFEFQTKHIDAFFSYLTPANISMQNSYENLQKQALDKKA